MTELYNGRAESIGGATDEPEVSWLICSHVANEQLRLALASCFNQTFDNFEVLFIANGPSSDQVANTVRDWFGADGRLRVLATEIQHLTFSLSLGLHHARAPFIARMDGDDLSRPDRLERQLSFLRTHELVVVLGSAYELIDEDGVVYDTVTLPIDNQAIRRALLKGNPLCHPSVMLRRQAILAAGGYLGGIHAQDYDLWTRLAVNPDNHFANLPIVCLGYRLAGVGTARKSRWAYAAVAAAQFRQFVLGAGATWCLAAVLSTVKAWIRSRPIAVRNK